MILINTSANKQKKQTTCNSFFGNIKKNIYEKGVRGHIVLTHNFIWFEW